jgi:hypothetical protein
MLDYLASKNVNPQRMWSQGYGEERTVRDCPDNSCKPLNLRGVTNLCTEFDESALQFKAGKVWARVDLSLLWKNRRPEEELTIELPCQLAEPPAVRE